MCDEELFKADFKYYKKKNPPPLYSKVIDFDLYNNFTEVFSLQDKYKKKENEKHCLLCEKLGLNNHEMWDLYSLKDLDGFIYIKNIFSVTGQQLWIRKCLECYPEKPSITNLDQHYPDVSNIWALHNHTDPDKGSYLYKLCWATMGYHHNWDTKVYDPENKSKFPPCLQELSQHIAQFLGFEGYKPEAAIVNYYNLKSSLGIHNDHSEIDKKSPIISFSFGQTGLFLIGTTNKCDKPKAIFLRSGDIIIMSGECRLSYHAVPCIIQEDISSRCLGLQESWKPFYEYINKARINISVRQVYPNKI